MRTETIDFKAFMKGQNRAEKVSKAGAAGVMTGYLASPSAAFAQSESGFSQLYEAALNIADWGCVGIIMFAGFCWMLGHRSKGLEFLMGASFGYLLVRHAMDVKNFLKTI